MTREEFLNKIQHLAKIDIPTEEEQIEIESLVSVFEASQNGGRVTELEAELETERAAHEELRKRFRENFWNGGGKSKEEQERPTAYEITLEDIFK